MAEVAMAQTWHGHPARAYGAQTITRHGTRHQNDARRSRGIWTNSWVM
jgi:hypothetical protein